MLTYILMYGFIEECVTYQEVPLTELCGTCFLAFFTLIVDILSFPLEIVMLIIKFAIERKILDGNSKNK